MSCRPVNNPFDVLKVLLSRCFPVTATDFVKPIAQVALEAPIVVEVSNRIAPVIRSTPLANHGLILEGVVIRDDAPD
jgi:hypothetical protein